MTEKEMITKILTRLWKEKHVCKITSGDDTYIEFEPMTYGEDIIIEFDEDEKVLGIY